MPTPRPDESEDEFVERCIPITIEDGTAEDGTQASAICHSMYQEAEKMNGSGIYLADPHGKLIWDGKKKFIAKAKEMDIEGGQYIVTKEECFGRADVGEAQPVESSEFDELFDVHRITHKERRKWWGKRAPLYLYEIKSFDKYDPPLEVVVPDGIQFVIDSVEFKDQSPEEVGIAKTIDDDVVTPSGDLGRTSAESEVEVEEKVEEKVEEEVDDEKAGRRIRTSKIDVLKELRKKLDEVVSTIKDLVGYAEYADKQPFYNLFNQKERGFKTFKNKKDGKNWILTWTTNSFIDREEEIFSQKSIEDYVERHFDDDVKGEFQFWHIPGTKYGDILWQGITGRFLVEAGPFDDTPEGRAFEKAFAEYPDGHPTIAPEGWGTSHKYVFKPEDREDGVYDWFDKEETTVLPMSAASNPHSPKLEVVKVEQKQIDALTEMIGDEKLVESMIATGEDETKVLEEAGIANKEKEGEDKSTDTSTSKEEKEVVTEIEGEVESEVGDETEEIEAEVEIEAESEVEASDEEIEEGEKEEIDEPRVATFDEVKEGFGALAGVLNDMVGRIESIEASVKSLEKDDEEKFSEMVEETPKESLKGHVESVIGNKETLVDGRTSLAKDGPEETEEKGESLTGVPLLDNIKKRNIDHSKA